MQYTANMDPESGQHRSAEAATVLEMSLDELLDRLALETLQGAPLGASERSRREAAMRWFRERWLDVQESVCADPRVKILAEGKPSPVDLYAVLADILAQNTIFSQTSGASAPVFLLAAIATKLGLSELCSDENEHFD